MLVALVLAMAALLGLIVWLRRRANRPTLLRKPDPSTRRDAFNDTSKYKRPR